MPKISALVHASNDAPRLGRALDSLRVCDEILLIDHHSDDETAKVARDHGAKVQKAVIGVEEGAYAIDTRHDWILCILPTESLSEALEAGLHEWKENDHEETGFAFNVREESDAGWKGLGPQMRLVNRTRINWTGALPPNQPEAPRVNGDLLRFTNP